MSIFGTELPGAKETALGAQGKLHAQGRVKTIGAGRVCLHTVPTELLCDSAQAAGRWPRCFLAGSQQLLSVPW